MSPRPPRCFRVILTETVVYTREVTARNQDRALELADHLYDRHGTDAFELNFVEGGHQIDVEEVVS